MSRSFAQLHDISFSYPSSPRTVLEGLSLHFTAPWTGIIGANGGGKTTLLELVVGNLEPDRGTIQRSGLAVLCPQRTDEPPALLDDFLSAPDNYRWLDALAVGYDWDDRWQTLSHGERKRAQLAVALWQAPDILAVDEPTNHLDREARALVGDALRAFRGVGLLVSHDRELLDGLCNACLFLEGGRGTLRPGNFSQAMAESERDAASRARRYEKARKEQRRLEREVRRAREEASRTATKLSKRHISRKDHDAKSKIDGARLTGKDAIPARLQKRLETRMHREAIEAKRHRPDPSYALGIAMGAETARGRHLLALEPMQLRLGAEGVLVVPALTIAPRDRIGIAGPNGSGKSTLARALRARLHLDDNRLLYLPQEMSAAEATALMQEIRDLPGTEQGHLMQLVSRLGSDPKRLRDSALPSPGETRKLMLALGLLREPHLILMDEPTNHMDLPSVTCLEAALADVCCALILVSHDARFLDALTTRRWQTVPAGKGRWQLEELSNRFAEGLP